MLEMVRNETRAMARVGQLYHQLSTTPQGTTRMEREKPQIESLCYIKADSVLAAA